MNPILELNQLGQSVWLDYIRRNMIASGELQRLVEHGGVSGITSNPAIFEKAINGSDLYADQLRELALEGKNAIDIYEAMAIQDIQMAADALAPVYAKTDKLDGYVSFECSPLLAHDTEGTIAEAKRLWQTIDRKNVMIKIPGTPAGMPAIEECIYEGLNINVTLLFSLDAYEDTMEAYIRGLERRAAEGKSVTGIASVASFFVSRIDTATDKRLDEKIAAAASDEGRAKLESLKGRIAIANAKMAYQRYKEIFHGERFSALKAAGAQVQRPLWASTSTKNPAYKDVYYVEALIGAETVDTVPPATLAAFRDHGIAKLTIEDNLDQERALLAGLEEAGISLADVTAHVVADAVRLFVEPFEKLIAAVQSHRYEAVAGKQSGTAAD